jgi:hypothetical protein
MSEGAAKQTPQNAVAQVMDEGGIAMVAVVDDVFAGPSVADYKPAEFEEFWAEVQYDDQALADLQTLGISITSTEDITGDVLKTLINRRAEVGRLGTSIDKYFAPTFEAKLAPVQKLCDCLERDLNRRVVKNDGTEDLKDPGIRLIFLDYYLEEGNEAGSIKKARRIAEGIAQQYGTNHRPLILLMSSKTDITEDMIASMRRGAKFLGSMFEFIPKVQFQDTAKFVVNLGCIARSLPERQRIQRFVEGVENSIPTATERLEESIRGLSFEDYAYIQRLSLQREGHPLGDYVSWLYSSYFGHLLFDAITEREILDGLTFSKLPAAAFTPSIQFVEMFKNVVTEAAGPITGHPRDKNAGSEDAPLMLHFGDVLSNDGTEIYMVISAECDLAFTPDESDRPYDPGKTILLIPGTLTTQDESGALKTEFFAHKNETKGIRWHPKRAISIAHGEMRAWLTKSHYKREARLRLPFALEIQQAFAADLTRIGMPVGPPVIESAAVQLACEDKDKQIHVVWSWKRAAFIFHGRDEQFVLSRRFIVELGDAIDKAVEVLNEAKRAHVAKGGNPQKHDGRIAQIEALKANFADRVEFCGPFKAPSSGGMQLKNLPVEVFRNRSMEGKYNAVKPLMLNIVAGAVAITPEVEAGVAAGSDNSQGEEKDGKD